jgi:hypothetical protein
MSKQSISKEQRQVLIKALEKVLKEYTATPSYQRRGLCMTVASTPRIPSWAYRYIRAWIRKSLGGKYGTLEDWVNARHGSKPIHRYPELDRRPWIKWMIRELKEGR